MQYANVIVDLSAEAVDRLFTYAVPEGMRLEPGQQVCVPLDRAGWKALWFR